MSDKPLNLYQKLVEVRKEVPYLQKDTEGYKYKYVAGADVLAPIITKMNELNLLLVPKITKFSVSIEGKKRIVQGKMLMTWINADNPDEQLEVPFLIFGEQDDISKAFGSGLTYSERYFMLKFFNIATDKDDPDYWLEKHSGENGKKKGKESPKGKFEQELEDDKKKDTGIDKLEKDVNEMEKKNMYVKRIRKMLYEYDMAGQNLIIYFVFKIKNVYAKDFSLSQLEEGGKKIKAMLEIPANIERLRGKTDQPLIDPTADPITPAGHVDPEKGAVEWKKNLERIEELEGQMPPGEYEGAKVELKYKHFKPIKPLAEQRKVIKHLEDIVEKINQSTERE